MLCVAGEPLSRRRRPHYSESGPCAAESHSARSVSNRKLDCYDVRLLLRERYTLTRIAESRQLRAQLQPIGLPSPWPGALHRAPPVKECDEPRGRCDAGRVLPDHRVLIARSSILGGARVESRRTAMPTGSSDLAIATIGGGLATRQRDARVTLSRETIRHRHLCASRTNQNF